MIFDSSFPFAQAPHECCHASGGWHPDEAGITWMPASAGMTKKHYKNPALVAVMNICIM